MLRQARGYVHLNGHWVSADESIHNQNCIDCVCSACLLLLHVDIHVANFGMFAPSRSLVRSANHHEQPIVCVFRPTQLLPSFFLLCLLLISPQPLSHTLRHASGFGLSAVFLVASCSASARKTSDTLTYSSLLSPLFFFFLLFFSSYNSPPPPPRILYTRQDICNTW